MTLDRQRALFYYKPPPPPPPPPAGEAVFVANGQAASRYQTFIVPDRITSISAVVVSYASHAPGAEYSTVIPCAIKRGGQTGTDLLSTTMPLNVNGVGGGMGGRRGADFNGDSSNSSAHYSNLSGGGAAGYTGNGGNGGIGAMYGYSYGGGAGSGGGGAGGDGYSGQGNGRVYASGAAGGGVGLFGQGNNGVPDPDPYSEWPKPGGNGSMVSGPYVGAGGRNASGGDLRWKNNIPVTPGEVLTIDLGSSYRNGNQGAGCRIMYGDNRSFPTNAGNAVPQGQTVISAKQNATFIVPTGVTSICIACQQYSNGGPVTASTAADVILVRAQNGARIGDGGGDGGPPGEAGNSHTGGGGCGRFTSDGGQGGGIAYTTTPGEWIGLDGTNGGGKGSSYIKDKGAVFGGQQAQWYYTDAQPGASTGIQGPGNDPVNGNIGGGSPGYFGGALAYKNNIAVAPGDVIKINSGGGRVRIIWGPNRSYPNSALDI